MCKALCMAFIGHKNLWTNYYKTRSQIPYDHISFICPTYIQLLFKI